MVVKWYLVVVVPEADADGAAGSGQHGGHGVHVNEHVRHALQNQLLVHDRLREGRGDKSGL